MPQRLPFRQILPAHQGRLPGTYRASCVPLPPAAASKAPRHETSARAPHESTAARAHAPQPDSPDEPLRPYCPRCSGNSPPDERQFARRAHHRSWGIQNVAPCMPRLLHRHSHLWRAACAARYSGALGIARDLPMAGKNDAGKSRARYRRQQDLCPRHLAR